MGVLSDLVVVPESELSRVEDALNPAAELGGYDVKGLDTVKLYKLHMLLLGSSFEDAMDAFPTSGSEEGPWVTRFPADFVARLSALSEERREKVAHRWARAEEFAADRWDASNVAAALECICELARKAHASGQLLVLWMSL